VLAQLLALTAAIAWTRKLVHSRSSRTSTDPGSGNGANEPAGPPMTLIFRLRFTPRHHIGSNWRPGRVIRVGLAMSAKGHKRKSSPRAFVVRSSPDGRQVSRATPIPCSITFHSANSVCLARNTIAPPTRNSLRAIPSKAKLHPAETVEPKRRFARYFAMARKSDFRRKAKACAWLAQRAHDPGVKARYAIVADEWMAMAKSPANGLGGSARQKAHLGRKSAAR
jgi:hypothetical protein